MRLKNIEVTVQGICSYEAASYTGQSTETKYIYTMQGSDGTVYAWKHTTSILGYEEEVEGGEYHYINKDGKKVIFHRINKDAVIVISATVKGEDEYNGQPQTVVNRVKLRKVLLNGKSFEEIQAEKEAEEKRKKEEKERKIQEQIDSLTGDDFIWERMPYKQYKDHYGDCETIIDSFVRERGRCYIDVIVREGRLKASGSRGKSYHYFLLQNDKGKKVCYKAINHENAIRRAEKEYAETTWELID